MSTNQKEMGKEQRTVLYVDDEPDMRSLFEALLYSHARRRGVSNVKVLTAANFAEAWKVVPLGLAALVSDGQVEVREGTDGDHFIGKVMQVHPTLQCWMHSGIVETGQYDNFKAVKKPYTSQVVTEVLDFLQS